MKWLCLYTGEKPYANRNIASPRYVNDLDSYIVFIIHCFYLTCTYILLCRFCCLRIVLGILRCLRPGSACSHIASKPPFDWAFPRFWGDGRAGGVGVPANLML